MATVNSSAILACCDLSGGDLLEEGPITRLPTELIDMVLAQLETLKDLANFARTSKRHNAIAQGVASRFHLTGAVFQKEASGRYKPLHELFRQCLEGRPRFHPLNIKYFLESIEKAPVMTESFARAINKCRSHLPGIEQSTKRNILIYHRRMPRGELLSGVYANKELFERVFKTLIENNDIKYLPDSYDGGMAYCLMPVASILRGVDEASIQRVVLPFLKQKLDAVCARGIEEKRVVCIELGEELENPTYEALQRHMLNRQIESIKSDRAWPHIYLDQELAREATLKFPRIEITSM